MPRRSRRFSAFSVASLLLAGLFLFQTDLLPERYSVSFPEDPRNPNFTRESTLISAHLSTHLNGPLPGKNNKTSTDLVVPTQVAIVEALPCHGEVVAALVHSFASNPSVNLSLYQNYRLYGIEDVMRKFELPRPLPTIETTEKFEDVNKGHGHDFVILITCELYFASRSPYLNHLLRETNSRLFCVVHHADYWDMDGEKEREVRPWVMAERIDFVTLSSHTAKFLKRQRMNGWTHNLTTTPLIREYTPVFPVEHPNTPYSDTPPGIPQDLAFTIQGLYEDFRRDYSTIFTQLQKFVNTHHSKDASVTLHLLGSGATRPPVPTPLAPHVIFDSDLKYTDYYAILSRSFAVLPAFASIDYLDRKASSSVPASLIGGAPLVATREIWDSYSYLSPEAVYFQEWNETELDVVERVLQMTEEQRSHMILMARESCARLIESNKAEVSRWIDMAERKMGRPPRYGYVPDNH